jgi:hypothetical protein
MVRIKFVIQIFSPQDLPIPIRIGGSKKLTIDEPKDIGIKKTVWHGKLLQSTRRTWG